MHIITKRLLQLKDENYKIFSLKLIPDTNKEIIGVRTPSIKNLVKEYKYNQDLIDDFLAQEHNYHEEFIIHGQLLGLEKNIYSLLHKLTLFSTQIDNWAVCDSTVSALKLLNKHPTKTLEKVKDFINSNNPYVVRLGVVILLSYFLDENFDEEILQLVKGINSSHYYVNMAIAWFYSVALVKQYNLTVKILQDKTLPKFIQNKSIQKAVESFRISNDKKSYLKTLKV